MRPAATRRSFSLGLDRFSGLYVWAALILLFGLWIPDLFLTGMDAASTKVEVPNVGGSITV